MATIARLVSRWQIVFVLFFVFLAFFAFFLILFVFLCFVLKTLSELYLHSNQTVLFIY